jgi:hypothetical protein
VPVGKGSKRSRASKELPWAALLQGGIVVAGRWRRLSEKDRARLRRLLRESGGHVGSLTDKQRKELRKLAGKLDLPGLGRELTALAKRGRGRSRA